MSTEFYKETFTYKLFLQFFNQTINWFETMGYIGQNFLLSIKYILKLEVDKQKLLEQSSRFGVDSLPLTISIVGLSGMIIALQVASEMVKQGAGSYVGSLVTASIIREIGPIMGSFAVISMVGSSMAAEIATMKVTDQISAMKTLKVDPLQILLAPRILAGFLVMPLAIIVANTAGILGGMLSSTGLTELSILNYTESVWRGLAQKDIFVSILKGSIFGGIIALISTSIGYKAEGGAIDVGNATTRAVVWSFIAVVILDYLLSLMFFK